MFKSIKLLGIIAILAAIGAFFIGCPEPETSLPPELTGTVSITGTAQVGQTLIADTSSLGGNGTIIYQWRRDTVNVIGTNSSSYTIQTADAGSTITVTVTRAGFSGSVTSAPRFIELVLVETPGLSYTLIENGTAYSVSVGTATASNVVIPSVYNGLPVTSIRDNAFNNRTSLTSITIPNSVTSIGGWAFGRSGLTSVTIPNSVTSIGDGAFAFCTDLTSIIIPNSVTSIGHAPFRGSTGLTSINVDLNNPNYTSQDGILYNKTKTQLINYPSASGNITIPNSVTSIGQWAFVGCTGLTSITIPNSVTSIVWSFAGCTGLTSINVDLNNPNYTSQDGILYNKTKTQLISYPSASGNITIPNSVTSIGNGAFSLCTGLTNITIPNSVTSIGDWAFDCTGLTSITIPNSVTSIGDWAFLDCTGLTSVTFMGTIISGNFSSNNSFPGDLRSKYLNGGIGTYTRVSGSDTWTKE